MRLSLSRPPLLGIDLHPGCARLVACSRTRRTWRVDRWAERELAPDSLLDGQVRQFELVSSVLRDLVHMAGDSRRIALCVPHAVASHHELAVPASVRPWAWRSWLRQQAEELAGAPFESLALDVQMLQASPLRVLLSLCPREAREDWHGLAEAAGLALVLLDDRPRVMRLALQALGLSAAGGSCVLAEVDAQRCQLHVWRPAQAPQSLAWDETAEVDLPVLVQSHWLAGEADPVALWATRLQSHTGAAWSATELHRRLDWAGQDPAPPDADAFLAAFGLALRAWLH